MPQSYHHGYTGYECPSHHYPAYLTTPTINNQIQSSGNELKSTNDYGLIYHHTGTELNTSSESLDVEKSPAPIKIENYSSTCCAQQNRTDEYNPIVDESSPFASPHTNTVTSEHVQELDSMCHLSDAKETILKSNL